MKLSISTGILAWLLSCCLLSSVDAKVITLHETASYIMSDMETPSVAAERATQMARRQAVEKVAVYVKSYTKTSNAEVEKDDIEVISVGLMKDQEVPKTTKTLTSDNQMQVTSDIVVQIETDEIEQLMAKVQRDLQYREKYVEVRDNYIQVQKEMEDLKKQLALVQNESDKQKLKEKLVVNEQKFTAVEWFKKGKDVCETKDYERAIDCFSKAIVLEPTYVEAYNNRGVCYDKLEQYDKALADYDSAVALKDDNTQNYINRGTCYLHMMQFGNAFLDYSRAIALGTKYATAYLGRGFCYMQSERYEDAIKDFNTALTLRYSCPEKLHYLSGECCAKLREYEQALACYSKAIALKQDYVEAYVGRGICYSELKQYKNALENCNKAIDLEADCDIAYYVRGFVFYTIARRDLAKLDFQKCLDITSNDKIRKSVVHLLKQCE